MKPIDTKLYRVFFWLAAASFLTPLVYNGAFYEPFTATKTFFLYFVVELTLPFYLYLCFRYFGFRHLKNPIVYLSTAFLGLSLLSSVVGVNFINSFWGDFSRMQGVYLAIYMFAWLCYLTLIFKIDPNKIDWLFNIFIVVAVITAVHGILQQIGIATMGNDFPTRSVSVFGNPIFFSAFLVIPFFLALYQFVRTNKNYWFLGFAVIILGGILSTKTVAADLGVAAGLAVGVLIYFWLSQNKKAVAVSLAVLVVLAGATVFGIAKSASLHDRFLGSDAESRLIEWKIALRGFPEKPILGVGPENYLHIASKYIDDRIYIYSNGFFDKPHNYFLEVLDTRGVVGFVVYVALIWFAVIGLWRLYKKNQLSLLGFAVLLGGLAAYMIQNFFAFDMIAALMALTLLYAFTSLGWESAETHPMNKKSFANVSFILAGILFVYLSGINITMAKANIELADGLKYIKSNPILPAGYYEHLANSPVYADPSVIGVQFEEYVTNLSQQYGVNKDVTLNLIEQEITSAIAVNQKIVDRNPNYFANFVSLGNLYVLKSQAELQIDPKLFAVTDEMEKLAPNRIEADVILIAAYGSDAEADKAQAAMADMEEKAPRSPVTIWEQVYVDAVSGKAEQVLTEVKNIINESLDSTAISQLDRIAIYYINSGNYRQGVALYNEAVVSYPSNGYFYMQLARTYVSAGDKMTAQQVINILKQKNSQAYDQYKSQISTFLSQ